MSNLQGTGTTIVRLPSLHQADHTCSLSLPQTLAECPGGVGLTTSMTMLKTGWVIVGSHAQSRDGTTATKGDGCLIVLDPNGKPVSCLVRSRTIIDPWGNMAVEGRGGRQRTLLFISMAGEGIPKSPDVLDPKTSKPARVVDEKGQRASRPGTEDRRRERRRRSCSSETVVGDGFSASEPDRDNFLLGPTGEALSARTARSTSPMAWTM